MNYAPHTPQEIQEMLERIGLEDPKDLFVDVPEACRFPKLDLPEPLSELELVAELQALAQRNLDLGARPCFLGAGAYQRFIPSVVNHIVSRSEFYTAYTPYQPEISQGTLQAIFEYQTMICALTEMEVSNASHYDGATATAEAAMMAIAVSRGRRRRVVVSTGVHPEYRATLKTYLQGMEANIIEAAGSLSPSSLIDHIDNETACLIIQNPDFYGRILDLRGVADSVHARGALLIIICDPISLGLLRSPGSLGADIAVGEGQSLGIPLQFGGPYLGFFTCRKAHVRRMAGRLVGETVDVEGRRGFVLTLATREQHIRRGKATSNICTNQGLNALAAGVYLAALGKRGLRQVALLCYHRSHYAAQRIDSLAGYTIDLGTPFFQEFVVHCPRPVSEINHELLERYDILGGYDLKGLEGFSERDMLLCVTEMNSRAEIDRLIAALEELGT